uniref:hypothetical protein n=1 Tax=Streptococcus pneumoniae TaxID=1313 RepID=UPI0013DD1FA3
FRYLASPLTTIKANAIHSAFDLSIMPGELAADVEGDADEAAAVSTLVYETGMAVTADTGTSPSFSVDAIRNGQSLGTFHV